MEAIAGIFPLTFASARRTGATRGTVRAAATATASVRLNRRRSVLRNACSSFSREKPFVGLARRVRDGHRGAVGDEETRRCDVITRATASTVNGASPEDRRSDVNDTYDDDDDDDSVDDCDTDYSQHSIPQRLAAMVKKQAIPMSFALLFVKTWVVLLELSAGSDIGTISRSISFEAIVVRPFSSCSRATPLHNAPSQQCQLSARQSILV